MVEQGNNQTSDPEEKDVATSGLIEQANKAIVELKEQLDRREKLLLEEKELEMRKTLAGRSLGAAAPAPTETAEEKAKKEAADFIKQTGLKF